MNQSQIQALCDQYMNTTIQIRRKLHARPEIAFCETETGKTIKEALDEAGIPYKSNIAKTGIVAKISSGKAGKTLLVRADMDALPVTEETSLPFSSENPGVMHACGHDAHMAAAILAGRILNETKEAWCGSVILAFQPAEETDGGAKPMIDEGILTDHTVDYAIAAHVMPELPVGQIMIKEGSVMASPDDFEITFTGKGGHGASPETAINPITMGERFVSAMQDLADEFSTPIEPCVISICSFHSGTCRNVIPETATISGTFRTLTPTLRQRVAERIETEAKRICIEFGGSYNMDMNLLYPPVINDPQMVKQLRSSAQKVLGPDAVLDRKKASMCGDDFAYFAEAVSSVYFHAGCGDQSRTAPIHSPHFDLNEDVIGVIATCISQFAVDIL